MLGTAYGSVGVLGFLVYRGLRKNQRYLDAQAQEAEARDRLTPRG